MGVGGDLAPPDEAREESEQGAGFLKTETRRS